MTILNELDAAIASLQALVKEYEPDPASDQYIAARDSLEKFIDMRCKLVEGDLKKEETLRRLEMQEKESEAKIEEIIDRGSWELKKVGLQLAGTAAIVWGITIWEEHGHLLRDGAVRAVGAIKRAIF